MGEWLVREGRISVSDLEILDRESGHEGAAFAKSVLALGLFRSQFELANYIAKRSQFPYLKGPLNPDPDAMSVLDLPLLIYLEVIPLAIEGKNLRIAMPDPLDTNIMEQLKFFSPYPIKPIVVKLTSIAGALRRYIPDFKLAPSPLGVLFKRKAFAKSPLPSPDQLSNQDGDSSGSPQVKGKVFSRLAAQSDFQTAKFESKADSFLDDLSPKPERVMPDLSKEDELGSLLDDISTESTQASPAPESSEPPILNTQELSEELGRQEELESILESSDSEGAPSEDILNSLNEGDSASENMPDSLSSEENAEKMISEDMILENSDEMDLSSHLMDSSGEAEISPEDILEGLGSVRKAGAEPSPKDILDDFEESVEMGTEPSTELDDLLSTDEFKEPDEVEKEKAEGLGDFLVKEEPDEVEKEKAEELVDFLAENNPEEDPVLQEELSTEAHIEAEAKSLTEASSEETPLLRTVDGSLLHLQDAITAMRFSSDRTKSELLVTEALLGAGLTGGFIYLCKQGTEPKLVFSWGVEAEKKKILPDLSSTGIDFLQIHEDWREEPVKEWKGWKDVLVTKSSLALMSFAQKAQKPSGTSIFCLAAMKPGARDTARIRRLSIQLILGFI